MSHDRSEAEAAARRQRNHVIHNLAIGFGGLILLMLEVTFYRALIEWTDEGTAMGIVVATIIGIPMILAMRFVVTADRRSKDRKTMRQAR